MRGRFRQVTIGEYRRSGHWPAGRAARDEIPALDLHRQIATAS
jgi:hypothetical protein